MELNPILIDGFVIAIQNGTMDIEQVPIPYQEIVGDRLEPKE